MQVDFEQKRVLVYDGRVGDLASWREVALKLLKHCGVVDLKTTKTFIRMEDEDEVMFLGGDINDWKLTGPFVFITQSDGHSCGPIACIKLMSLFNRIPDDVDVHTVPAMELRRIVMDDFRKVCGEIDDDIRV